MQAEVDGLNMDVKRKESSLDLINAEKDRVLNRLRNEEGDLYNLILELRNNTAVTLIHD